jgi:hypothetical protein
MKAAGWGDALGAVFLLAVVYLLARRRSIAPQLVTAFGAGLDTLVRYAVSG